MKTTYFKYIIIGFASILGFASCKVSQVYQRPNVVADKLYRDSSATANDSTSMAEMPWKSLFSDTTLQGLIQEGIDNNLNLKRPSLKLPKPKLHLTKASWRFSQL